MGRKGPGTTILGPIQQPLGHGAPAAGMISEGVREVESRGRLSPMQEVLIGVDGAVTGRPVTITTRRPGSAPYEHRRHSPVEALGISIMPVQRRSPGRFSP